MRRILVLLIFAAAVPAVIGCGGSTPPPATGEAFTPPKELDQMKNEMMDRYKKGEVGKAPSQ